jgi:hypothetical protein
MSPDNSFKQPPAARLDSGFVGEPVLRRARGHQPLMARRKRSGHTRCPLTSPSYGSAISPCSNQIRQRGTFTPFVRGVRQIRGESRRVDADSPVLTTRTQPASRCVSCVSTMSMFARAYGSCATSSARPDRDRGDQKCDCPSSAGSSDGSGERRSVVSSFGRHGRR